MAIMNYLYLPFRFGSNSFTFLPNLYFKNVLKSIQRNIVEIIVDLKIRFLRCRKQSGLLNSEELVDR